MLLMYWLRKERLSRQYILLQINQVYNLIAVSWHVETVVRINRKHSESSD